MVLAVLKHEDAVILQQPFFEDKVGNGGQFFQGVGWVGKDKVKLLMATLEKTKHIGTEGNTTIVAQFLYAIADETVVVSIHLHTNHLLTAARQQLERDAACAREKVERDGFVQIYILCQHIEDVLLGKVGGRPRLERARDVEMPSFVFACDNAHSGIGMKTGNETEDTAQRPFRNNVCMS